MDAPLNSGIALPDVDHARPAPMSPPRCRARGSIECRRCWEPQFFSCARVPGYRAAYQSALHGQLSYKSLRLALGVSNRYATVRLQGWHRRYTVCALRAQTDPTVLEANFLHGENRAIRAQVPPRCEPDGRGARLSKVERPLHLSVRPSQRHEIAIALPHRAGTAVPVDRIISHLYLNISILIICSIHV